MSFLKYIFPGFQLLCCSLFISCTDISFTWIMILNEYLAQRIINSN